ncbi:glycosyltransferase family 9 protein [Helicobacter pylori]|uniref:glycosyltransferase family 9 protein n=1 Tax=Helicobacter pylori TaxID=210 RepID=UPI000991BC1E|nr:glycosyltransferase family 9 protein [Helicobacter pylori]NGP55497.1 glycosyltransferase family 9 protein [Helicobacter pylori]OOQ15622.1 glycosyltransferase 9 family protein [Helicobacter pylori]PDW96915.1 glycosyltransferase 9 family protein [Helicobacter pylori]
MRIACLLALGDNLITLSLLKEIALKQQQPLKILGTHLTLKIAKLLECEKYFEIIPVFENVPAFYDLKKQGVFLAMKDFLWLLKALKEHEVKRLILEKQDFRSALLAKFIPITTPNKEIKNVYQNRQGLFSQIYGHVFDNPPYPMSLKNPKKILINPFTRENDRNISLEHLQIVLKLLKPFCVTLLDFEERYAFLKDRVAHYRAKTSLEEVKNLILESDLYIGGDSFLIHLAYYLKKNYFIFFYRDNDDFMPPKNENFLKAHKSHYIEQDLAKKFRHLGLL